MGRSKTEKIECPACGAKIILSEEFVNLVLYLEMECPSCSEHIIAIDYGD